MGVSINIDFKTQEVSFALPDFGVGYKDTYIPSEVWKSCADELLRSEEAWGIIELGYAPFKTQYEVLNSGAKV